MSKSTKWKPFEWEHERDKSMTDLLPKRIRERIEYKTARHATYAKAIEIAGVVFCTGPAGTGKSYVACAKALEFILDANRPYEQVIVCRSNAGVGRTNGYIPGYIEDKNRPWMESAEDNFLQALGENHADTYRKMLKDEQIVFENFEYMRGKNFRNAVVILEEAQNCEFHELKTLLTRGYGTTKFLCNGDLSQCDIPYSGFREVIRRTRKDPEIEHVALTSDENMRGDLNRRLTLYLDKPERRFHGVDVSFFSQ